jgi:hypothetical protein
MKTLTSRLIALALLVFALGVSIINAQEAKPFIALVKVDSAFARVAPTEDAEAAASLFRDDRLQVVSRNLDGSWFEVRRPGRLTNLGWVFNKMLDWDFLPENLPLGDIVTGVTGPSPLLEAPDFAGYLLEGPALRDRPSFKGLTITTIPPLITIPILERNQNGTWLHVNYLGYDGWIAGFLIRRLPNLMDIPEAANLPALETIPVVVIPVEIQQAQVDRLRAFTIEHRDFAIVLESFWWDVFRGAVKPCEPPAAVTEYAYGEQDVRELPELQRYTPRLATAIDYLSTSIDPLTICGVLSPDLVGDARDAAINARIIFDATLQQLTNLEDNIIRGK